MVKDLNELMKERVKDYEASRGGETQIDAVKYHVERGKSIAKWYDVGRY